MLAVAAGSVLLVGLCRPLAEAGASRLPALLLPAVTAPLVLVALGALIALAYRSAIQNHQVASKAAPGRLADPKRGLLAPFVSADSASEAALRVEQARHIFEQLDVMMAINIVNALLITASIHDEVDRLLLGSWLLVVVAMAVMGVLARSRSHGRPAPARVSKRTLRRITLHAGVRGLVWGAAFALFFPSAGPTGQLVLLSVAMGLTAGGVPALAPVPSAALWFGLGIVFPTLLLLATSGTVDALVLTVFGLTFSASMVMIAGQLYRSFAANVLMRREQAEQAATISMLLHEFEASASDWLWETDGEGHLVRMPRRLAELLAPEMPHGDGHMGKPGLRLLDALAERHADGTAALALLMEKGAPFRDAVVQVADAAGEARSISLSASPKDGGGYRGVGSDITARVSAQKCLAEALARAERAEQRLKDGIETLGVGFILTDGADRPVIANARSLDMLPASGLLGAGATFAEIADAHASLAFTGDPEKGRAWRQALLQSRERGAEPVDLEMPGERWLRVNGAPTTDGGVVTVLTDVTDIKRQEAKLASQAERLKASNGELEQFATVASHDLQEPLRKIEAFGARLKARSGAGLDADCTLYVDRMLAASGRMRRLITDLLSFSRVARKGADFRPVGLDGLLNDVRDDLSIQIEERGARIEASGLGTVNGDPTQLRQLFQNLIGNSLKFAKPGVPTVIGIERRARSDGQIELRFSDNGIGFDMAFREKIFEIFQRLHGREAYEGTGVGLATCRRIVERHGGTLTAESVPGQGATFIAIFPAVPVPAGRPADAA